MEKCNAYYGNVLIFNLSKICVRVCEIRGKVHVRSFTSLVLL
jgi:hypothetical protein